VIIQPTAEPRESLRNTILNCKMSSALRAYGDAAVAFIISRVGNSQDARVFLDELRRDKKIGGMVYCSPEDMACIRQLDRGCVCHLSPYIRRSDQRLWASRSSSRLAVCSRVEGFEDSAGPLHFHPRNCWRGSRRLCRRSS